MNNFVKKYITKFSINRKMYILIYSSAQEKKATHCSLVCIRFSFIFWVSARAWVAMLPKHCPRALSKTNSFSCHISIDSKMDWNEVASHMVSKTSSFLEFFFVGGSRSHRVPLYLHLLLSVPLNLFLLKSRDRSVRFVFNTSFHVEMDWEMKMGS